MLSLLDIRHGKRVKTLREFVSVPEGTEGIIDELYTIGNDQGFMVAWDFEGAPLPKDYKVYDGRPAWMCNFLRDGFSMDERQFLMAVEEKKQ